MLKEIIKIINFIETFGWQEIFLDYCYKQLSFYTECVI